ncbi:MAG: BspA family leucine-rich repeat surface protein [Oscillospiraceae bacterium]|nr:BspA family leucine-rich repeat surface protein [Oscillospiraceae bacterium]
MSSRKGKKSDKNKLAILVLLFACLLAIVGILAVFSDFALGQLFGTAGTLDIVGEPLQITRHHMVGTNEFQETGEDVSHLNPGDILEITFDLENEGNKSAWLRHLITLDIILDGGTAGATGGAFELHAHGTDRNTIRYAGAGRATPLEIATIFGFEHTSDTIIINGSGANAEIEVQGEGPELVIGFYIYFKPTAGMEYQNASIALEILTQAMQYRNNQNPVWANVVDREFILGDPGRYVIAYGVITANNSNLPWRLYNDGILEMSGGNIQWGAANSPWLNYNDYIEGIIFHESVMAGTSMRGLFANLNNATFIEGLDNFNTQNVINMSEMFVNTSSLTSLDLSTWNTSNVTNMGAMFFYATSLTNLNVSTWNTSNVTNMINMFRNVSLTSLDVSNWDTGNVIDMRLLFAGASELVNLDVSNWNTSSVTNMSSIFNGTSSLTSIDLSNWNTSNVTNMGSMFSDANSLSNIGDVSNWDVSNVTTMNRMFLRTAFESLDLSGWNTSSSINMESIFGGINTINSIKLGENFIIVEENLGLTNVPNNLVFTGMWTNVGTSSPAGSLTFNAAGLINHIRNNPANETWVWQTR